MLNCLHVHSFKHVSHCLIEHDVLMIWLFHILWSASNIWQLNFVIYERFMCFCSRYIFHMIHNLRCFLFNIWDQFDEFKCFCISKKYYCHKVPNESVCVFFGTLGLMIGWECSIWIFLKNSNFYIERYNQWK
jgi:hypothetical protein